MVCTRCRVDVDMPFFSRLDASLYPFFFYIDSEPHRRHLGEDIKPRKGPKSLLVGFLSLHGCLAVTIVVVVKWLVHVAVLGGGVLLPRDKRNGWAEKSRDGLF